MVLCALPRAEHCRPLPTPTRGRTRVSPPYNRLAPLAPFPAPRGARSGAAPRGGSSPSAGGPCLPRHLAGRGGPWRRGQGCCHPRVGMGGRLGGRGMGCVGLRRCWCSRARSGARCAPCARSPGAGTRREEGELPCRDPPHGGPGAAGWARGCPRWRRLLAGVTLAWKWRLQTKDRAGGGELRPSWTCALLGAPGRGGLLCTLGVPATTPPATSTDVPSPGLDVPGRRGGTRVG